MKPTRILISLISADNDYQKEQAASALQVRGSDVNVEIIYADHDAVNQTQQLVKAIQDRENRPEAILVEPVGTGMPQVAGAAVAAGIAWGIVNCEVDYVSRLRRTARAPVFAVTTDQQEVGRIQGRQFKALLGDSGAFLYIEGPGTSSTAKLRSAGMMSAKPVKADVKALKGDWSEASGYRAVKSWLSLSTSRQLHIQAVGCQNDAMAAGARRAFQELPASAEKEQWLKLPFTGCDGVPGTGQKWVQEGLLAATVIISPTMGIALRLLRDAISSGSQPPEHTLSAPTSFPALPELAQRAQNRKPK